MSRFFDTWRAAREYAEEQTARLKVAHGIEKVDGPLEKGFVVRMLPRPENRQGWELRCEAVEVGFLGAVVVTERGEPRVYARANYRDWAYARGGHAWKGCYSTVGHPTNRFAKA